MLVLKKHNTLDHCKWRPEAMTVPLECMVASVFLKKQRTLIEISVKYMVYLQFVVASALLKNTVFIKEWLARTTFVK